jgi:RNA-directed DNA polymerase
VPNSQLSLSDICQELGLQPQFLLELSEISSTLYTTFDVPKRSGGLRTLCVPKDRLKRVQRLLLDAFLSKIEMPPHVHGCVKGRSTVTNAKGHVNKPLVINIDLTDFFGSIGYDVVSQIFKTEFNCDKEAAQVLTRLTTYGNFLPQGAPTSPALANISALQLDRELIAICAKNGGSHQFHYTRYVDDISISGGRELALLLGEFYRAVHRNGFRANPKKLKFAGPSVRQRVTGVVVNETVSAPKKLIRKVRQQLYYCNKHTLQGHCERVGIDPEHFLNRIKGSIGYLRMTKPKLADEFHMKLTDILRKSMPLGILEQAKLVYLHQIIQEEAIARFSYEGSIHRVAPAQLWLDEEVEYEDDERVMVMRGFQLTPDQGWRKFYVSDIKDLARENTG